MAKSPPLSPEQVDQTIEQALSNPPAPEPPAADEKPAEDKFLTIHGEPARPTEAEMQAEFLQKLKDARAKSIQEPEPAPPPPRTARQLSQLEIEMEAGRKRQEFFVEELRNRPAPAAPDPSEGKTVPVFRPGDFVEEKKGDAARGVRAL